MSRIILHFMTSRIENMSTPSETPSPPKRGRKPIHESPAARAAAYRARKAAKIEAALELAAQAPDPSEFDDLKKQLEVVREQLRISETKLERSLAKSVSSRATKGLQGKPRAASATRMAALRKFYVDGAWPRPDDAKRLRVNTKKASGAATEILDVIKRLHFEMRDLMAGDMDALAAAATLLADYGSSLEKIQKDAEFAVTRKAVAQKKEHDERVVATIDEILPNAATRAGDAMSLAEDLVKYESTGRDWLASVRAVDRGTPGVQNDFTLREAIRRKDGALLARLVAETKIEMPKKGRAFQYDDDVCWTGCWNDFLEWRAAQRSQ